MKRLLSLIPIALLCAVALSAAPSPNPADVAKAVDRKYNELRSLRADFAESYEGAGLSRTESGTLSLLKPGKMRWDYAQPREKLFVTNGKKAWFYVPAERQVRTASVKKIDDLRSPIRYLLGHSRLEKEMDGLSFAPDVKPMVAGDTVLRGIPKAMADRVSQVVLDITPENLIRRVRIEEHDGTVTEFRFSNIVVNPIIEKKRFDFEPPAGTEVIESTELTQ